MLTSNSVQTLRVLVYFFFIVLGLLLLWLLREVVLLFFIASIINAGLRPYVDALSNRGVPRGISVLLILGGTLVVLTLLFAYIFNSLGDQATSLANELPTIITNFLANLRNAFPFLTELLPESSTTELSGSIINNFNSLLSAENIGNIAGGTLSIFRSIGGAFISGFTVIMLAVYLLGSKKPVYEALSSYLPKSQQSRVNKTSANVQKGLGAWFRGQIALMLFIGIITYVLIKLPAMFWPDYRLDDFALPIAIVAGLMELIPNIGPIVTLVFAGIIAIGTSGLNALLYVVVSFVALQNVESVFIVPAIMKRAVGLSPIVTILGIIGALQLGGVGAALVAVPVIATLQIIFLEALAKKP